MTTKFVVKKIETCTRCNGDMYIQHPAWEAYYKEIHISETIEMERDWFVQNGLYDANTFNTDGLPDEEIVCPVCFGNGAIVTEVSLAEAMRESGAI